eukprot:CAMPEP_0205908494 /NCGR_PEP_ID=MMETSP1325-20131115/3253_1 /ASSEMBLY_ACC=CAM_ASM_000708 /TAXON_ID=236786 /ORGANISM="Florenciella sp., Strain RCC1007" /LENGTH=50 /DNA_ID=CAMNT_0053274699 /DNA_START=315 /DNA_END=467 /DNA_ORIENTATION=+
MHVMTLWYDPDVFNLGVWIRPHDRSVRSEVASDGMPCEARLFREGVPLHS